MSSRSRLLLAVLLAVVLHGVLLLWTPPAPAPRLHVVLQLRSASAPAVPPVSASLSPPSPVAARHTALPPQQSAQPAATTTHPSRQPTPRLLQQPEGPEVTAGAAAPTLQVSPPADGRPSTAGAGAGPSAAVAPMSENLPDHPARARCRPAIRYPVVSRELEEQGVVVASVQVDALGAVQEVRLQQSSGAARLDRALLDSVPLWQFEPARQQGRAEGGTVLLRFVFQLQEGSGGEGHAGSSVRVCGG